jgi:predicted dehydrogenase
VAMVAFQTRFHPLYAEVKAALGSNEHGKVLSAQFQWCTFLPDHHPYEDYRAGYAARKDLGGGVLLGLIHELDLICSFWGFPDRVHSILANSGELEMDAEDTVVAQMRFQDRGRAFPVSLKLSYAQVNEERTLRIQFERATLYCDLARQVSRLTGRDATRIEKDFSGHSRNDLFLAEMKEFLEAIAARRPASPNLEDGIRSLLLAEMIRSGADRAGAGQPSCERLDPVPLVPSGTTPHGAASTPAEPR